LLVVEGGVLYMSWNGATKITSWLIFARESEPGLKIDGMLKSMEFGTMFEIHGSCETDLKVLAYRDAELLGIRTLWWLLYREEMAVLITSL
jgi:hypothetical protein